MRYYFALFTVVLSLHGLAQSLANYKDSLVLAETPVEKCNALTQLSEYYWYIHPDTAIWYGNRAVAVAKTQPDTSYLVYALNALGTAYYYKSTYQMSISTLLEAQRLAEKTQDTIACSVIYLNISMVYTELEHYVQAIDYLNRALTIDLNSDDPIGAAFEYLGIADILFKEDLYLEAQAYYLKGLELIENQEYYQELRSSAYFGLGTVLEKLGQDDLAMQRFRCSLKLSRGLADRTGIIEASIGLYRIHKRRGELEQAGKVALLALNESKKFKDPSLLATSYLNLSELQFLRKNLKGAKVHLSLVDSLIRNLPNGELHIKSLELNRDIARAENNNSRAWELQNELDQLNYQIWQNRVNQGLQVNQILNNQQETARLKERQSEIKARSLLQEEIITRNKMLLLAMSVLLMLAMGFLLQVYKQRNLQKRQNKLLENQQKELLDLHRTKDQLFSVISHDLKEPINQMQGLLSLMQNNALDEKERDELMAGIARNTETTRQNVENLLHWAQTQLQGETTESKSVYLIEVVHQTVGLLTTPVHLKNIQWEIAEFKGKVVFDPNHLELILRNLLSNAVKFAPKNSIISLDFETKKNLTELHIRDRGSGISELILEKLGTGPVKSEFGTNQEKGTGLGLALSYNYAQRNHAKIRHSNHPDGGTLVVLTMQTA